MIRKLNEYKRYVASLAAAGVIAGMFAGRDLAPAQAADLDGSKDHQEFVLPDLSDDSWTASIMPIIDTKSVDATVNGVTASTDERIGGRIRLGLQEQIGHGAYTKYFVKVGAFGEVVHGEGSAQHNGTRVNVSGTTARAGGSASVVAQHMEGWNLEGGLDLILFDETYAEADGVVGGDCGCETPFSGKETISGDINVRAFGAITGDIGENTRFGFEGTLDTEGEATAGARLDITF